MRMSDRGAIQSGRTPCRSGRGWRALVLPCLLAGGTWSCSGSALKQPSQPAQPSQPSQPAQPSPEELASQLGQLTTPRGLTNGAAAALTEEPVGGVAPHD